ncbi:MAG: winged helix-turn-helix domain-containing protein [Thermoplasmata archaeon]
MLGNGGGVGPALRRALGASPGGVRPPPANDSLLMNPTRLRLFHILCNSPCLTVRDLSRALGMGAPTVLWHLRRMIARGLIARNRLAGRVAYYPAGVLEEEDVRLLAIVNAEGRKRAVRAALERPGMTQEELTAEARCSAYTLRRLVSGGALEVLRDGRYRRYYPSAHLKQRREAFERRARRYRHLLLVRLEEEGLAPELSVREPGEFEFRVRIGSRSEALDILRNPYYFEKAV